ncbi:MAG: histidinol dehydrogenase [Luteibaculaceae bacterium]
MSLVTTYINPTPEIRSTLLKRPSFNEENITQTVQIVVEKVKNDGDKALFEFTERFDKCALSQLEVSQLEIEKAEDLVPQALRNAIAVAAANITKFHSAQQESVQKIETSAGVFCWRKSLPINKVGIYIPGGTAPLFSTVLMLAIPAKLAGCKEIILCSPPNAEGEINPAILYAAKLAGVTKAFKLGGAQAVAALALGTESVPKVDKIFGPGNRYVTTAKSLVQTYGTAIDMPAGPSELLIIADKQANPDFVAADLLSQAEHGTDSQVVLLTTDATWLAQVNTALAAQLSQLPRKEIATQALKNSYAVVLESLEECVNFSNFYAPEHLIINTENADTLAETIETAGSVFIGAYSCESFGDYASGTNHTLPTAGFARSYSGVSLDSFVKKVTFQKVEPLGALTLGPSVEIMAEAEELFAHKNAVTLRLNQLKK